MVQVIERTLAKVPTRHPIVPDRAVPLGEQQREYQLQRGLYVLERGERFAVPVDRMDTPGVYLGREFWRRDRVHGTHRVGVKFAPPQTDAHRRALAWLRDHVDERIPHWYYLAVLGHDLHVSTYGNLYGRHQHVGWADPFTQAISGPLDPTFEVAPWHPLHVARLDGESIEDWRVRGLLLNGNVPHGFEEALGHLSGGKVTDAFVSEEIDELVSATGTEYADFDFHEVGTSSTAENNNDTALVATSGIARATGTPTDADPIYRNVATITADATETWQEHGLFNNSTSVALMDRSLTGGQSVVASDQVAYTYELTKNPEA